MRASRYGVAAAIAGAVILGTAACGTAASPATSATGSASASPSGSPLAGLTADQIARKALADFRTVSSVHVAGIVTDPGGNIALNLTFGAKGCTGTLGVKGKGSFRLLMIGKRLWIKPDDQFWQSAMGGRATPDALQVLTGKYIEPGPKDTDLRSVGDLCSRSQFADHIGGQVTGEVKGATTTIAGQPALRLEDPADSSSAYVTISAHPELLRLDGGSDGRLDFTRYNAPMHLTPPPASEIVDGARYGF